MLNKLVDDAFENNSVKGALADGMYDSNKNLDTYQKTILNQVKGQEAIPKSGQLTVMLGIYL